MVNFLANFMALSWAPWVTRRAVLADAKCNGPAPGLSYLSATATVIQRRLVAAFIAYPLLMQASFFAQEADLRARYLEQYTQSPGGVNAQTGWFSELKPIFNQIKNLK